MGHHAISKEDLLLRIVKLKAENSLLRNKLIECGKDRALIQELEDKLKKNTDYRVIELNKRIEKLTQTIQNQRSHLRKQNGVTAPLKKENVINSYMEREIKFRAWDKDRNKMIYSFADKLNMKGYVLLWSTDNDRLFCGNYMDNGDWQEPELMQFTGLKDKNGKEIYEGDIVRFHANYSSNPCGYMNGLVTFKHLQWMIRSGNHLYSIYEETDEFENKSEIIGNAYENPEIIN